MKITPKFAYVEGSFDTTEVEMSCVVSDKHGRVALCIKEKGSGQGGIQIADIQLYNGNLRKDFDETKEDARKLGEEIARRWNTCGEKQ